MVGIPGTSKGCNTCRRRKVGCDQQKPYCNRCVRTGRPCEGYERPANFHRRTRTVSSEERGRNPSASRKSSSRPPLATPPSSRQSSNSDIFSQDCSRSKSSVTGPLTPPEDATIVPLARFSPIQAPADFPHNNDLTDQQLVHAFLDIYFPKDIVARHDSNHMWLQQAAFLPNPGEALRLALRALSLSRVGWVNNDEALMSEASSTYTAALSAFQQALWNSDLANRDETLAAGRVVTLYELFEATSFRGWNSHQMGLMSLYQMRGPDSLRTPLGRSLLESFRGPAMFHAIQFRTTSFLTYPEWRANLDDSTDVQQQLYDIGLRMAAFLHEQDSRRTNSVAGSGVFPFNMESGSLSASSSSTGTFPFGMDGLDGFDMPGHNLDTLRSDLNRFSSFNAELETFYARLVRECSHGGMPLYWDSSASTHTAFSDKQALPSTQGRHAPLHFPNLSVAQTLMNYWALQSLISSSIAGLAQSIKSAEADAAAFVFFDPTFNTEPDTAMALDPTFGLAPSVSPMQPDPVAEHLAVSPMQPDPVTEQLSTEHTMARCHHLGVQISRAVPYCSQEQMGLVGPQRCMFPARVAAIALKQGGPPQDLQYAQQMLDNLSSSKGLNYARQLHNLGGRWEEMESDVGRRASY